MKRTLPFALLAALIVVATASAAAPPKQMIGTWTRTVTAADVQRAGSSNVIPGLKWTLVIAQHGSKATVGETTLKGIIVPSSATQVNIELGVQKPNLYDWRRVGTKLILHARSEPVANRKAVLNGTWQRRG